jgi:GntR family transcriptional regulator
MEIDKQGSRRLIDFRLDVASGVPPYLQIVRQVEDALRLGYLQPGDQLPRVKDVVADLAINPNTVLKAYRELEQKGLVVGRPGQGTFVEATMDVVPLADRAAFRQRLRRWMSDALAAGLDEDSITAIFNLVRHEVTRDAKDVAS